MDAKFYRRARDSPAYSEIHSPQNFRSGTHTKIIFKTKKGWYGHERY